MKSIKREGTEFVVIQAYAAGDGHLSFVACLTEDCHKGPKGWSVEPLPTFDECKQLCPYGWELYQEGENWRARPAK